MKAILFVFPLLMSINAHSAPITPALTFNGLTWAQLSDTNAFYLSDVYNACGLNGEICSGMVNGKDLTGWRWANQNEVDTLISDFFGVEYTNDFNNRPNSLHLNTAEWFEYFSPTTGEITSIITIGFSSDALVKTADWIEFSSKASNTAVGYDLSNNTGIIFDSFPYFSRSGSEFEQGSLYSSGFFLMRDDYMPPSPVPIPAALYLFAPALLGFMGLRRKAKSS